MPALTRMAKLLVALTLVLSAVACGGGGSDNGSNSKAADITTTSSPSQLPVKKGDAPWPNAADATVPARVEAAGLVGAPTESTIVHYHAHLDIFVDGRSTPVADSIGRVDTSYFSPLHTHATSGLIHIEAPEDQKFTLGMLFTEWGVRLTDQCVGGYCRPDTPIAVYVDGKKSDADLPDAVFEKGEEIALVIGTPPADIPSSWDCQTEIDPTQENPAQCADFGQ